MWMDEKLVCGFPNKAIEQYYNLVQILRPVNETHVYDQLHYSKLSERR